MSEPHAPEKRVPEEPPDERPDAALQLPPSEMTGRKLGQYLIQEKIGQGGMGLVFRALDVALERPVALKVLPSGALDDQKLAERFMREARSLARLNHANLVHVYNVGSESDCFYFAMELLQGETLSAAIRRRGRIPANELLPWLAQILAALHYVHHQGILHRDIKSGNIMLNGHRAVLMDFGLAKDEHLAALTSAGAALGTPEFMAPESAEGVSAGPPTDLYSFGVVMYQSLSGKLPFTGRSALSIIRQHMDDPAPRLESVLPDVYPLLAASVQRCLEKKPQDRFPDCAALARELLLVQAEPELIALAGEHSLPLPPTLPSAPVASARRAEVYTSESTVLAGSSEPLRTEPVIDSDEVTQLKGKAWMQWMWVAAGFASIFLLSYFVLAIRRSRQPKPGPWQGQLLRRTNADGTASEAFRWIRFENNPDPAKQAYVIARQQPDGTWKRERLSPQEMLGGKGDATLDFVPEGAGAKP